MDLEKVNGNLSFVVDTSFVLSLGKATGWSLLGQQYIRDLNPEVIVPVGVNRELNRHYSRGTTRDGIPLLSEKPNIERLLGIESYKRYDGVWSEIFGDGEVGDIRFPFSLSSTDKSVIDATMDNARNGKKVAVASSDRALVDTVRELVAAEDLDVQVFSPWARSLVDITSSLDLNILVLSNVFGELYRTKKNDCTGIYLYVARDIMIRGQGLYDIAFTVLTRESVLNKLPGFEGVYAIPIVPIQFEDGKMKVGTRFTKVLTRIKSGFYSEQYPTTMGLMELGNPLQPYHLKHLLAREKNEGGLSQDENSKLLKDLQRKTLKWACLNHHLISQYDPEAGGTLLYFKRELDTHKH